MISVSSFATALEKGDYTIADGFQVNKAVTKGLVKHPIAATLDDSGRLFVIEGIAKKLNRKQLLKQKPYSVKLLTDTDSDGVFDTATVYANKLIYPGGLLWIYDSLYVTSPPGLLYFEDTNGDGVANVRQILAEGFEFTGKGTELYGPFLHPNGRLYWSHGQAKHEVKDSQSNTIISKGSAARIWSSDINAQDIRVHAGGGMRSPVELDFTTTGEVIGTASDFNSNSDALVHWMYGGVYPRKQKTVLKEFDQTGALLGAMHSFGDKSSSGMCRYRSGGLNKLWLNNVFVAHSKANSVTRSVTRLNGSGLAVKETKLLLKLKQAGARLTDVLEDFNGELLVCDSGKQGAIYRISKAGQTYQKAAIPTPDEWSQMDPISIAERLRSTNPFIHERAILEMAIRGHSSIPELRIILEESDDTTPEIRRNAIWALARMKFTESPALIEQALLDPDSSVQIAACNAIAATRAWQQVARIQNNDIRIEFARNKTISGILGRLVRSGKPEVARNAAVAVGAIAETGALGSLIGRVGKGEEDRMLQHSIIYAMKEMEASERLLYILKMGNTHQQNAALWALEGMESYQLSPLDIVLLLDKDTPELTDTVDAIVRRHPEWDAAIANQFYLFTDELTDARRDRIVSLAPEFSDTAPMQAFLDYVKENEQPEVVELAKQLAPLLK